MYGGVVGGLKTGTRLGAWTAAFVGLEEGVEYGVHRVLPGTGYSTRWASGGVAGLGLAAAAGQLCESTLHHLIKCCSNERSNACRLYRWAVALRRTTKARLGNVARSSCRRISRPARLGAV